MFQEYLAAGTTAEAPMLPAAAGCGWHLWQNVDGTLWAARYESEGTRLLLVPGVGRFYLEDSSSVRVFAEPNATEAAVRDAFARIALPLALHAHGTELLHASGVVTPSGVVAFCGRTEAGKSTLAYALRERGYLQWADDAVIFEPAQGRVVTRWLPFASRLRQASKGYFGVADAGGKEQPAWQEAREEQQGPLPLSALVVLRPEPPGTSSAAFSVERLAPAASLTILLEHAYCFSVADPERKRRMTDAYVSLCASVPVYGLKFVRELDVLPAILAALEQSVISQGLPTG